MEEATPANTVGASIDVKTTTERLYDRSTVLQTIDYTFFSEVALWLIFVFWILGARDNDMYANTARAPRPTRGRSSFRVA